MKSPVNNIKWIGLAEVAASDTGSLSGAAGAYVNAVGLASNKRAFRANVKASLADMGLTLLRLEDIEPFDNRTSKFCVSKEIMRMSEAVRDVGEVEFSTFQTYVK